METVVKLFNVYYVHLSYTAPLWLRRAQHKQLNRWALKHETRLFFFHIIYNLITFGKYNLVKRNLLCVFCGTGMDSWMD